MFSRPLFRALGQRLSGVATAFQTKGLPHLRRTLHTTRTKVQELKATHGGRAGRASLVLSLSLGTGLILTADPNEVRKTIDKVESKAKEAKKVLIVASAGFDPAYIVRNFVETRGVPVTVILGINTAVFLMWRIVPRHIMMRHFTVSVADLKMHGWKRSYTVLTSAFSHEAVMHFLFNMVALTSVAPTLNQVMGDQHFITFYIAAALFSGVVGCGGTLLQWVLPQTRLMNWMTRPNRLVMYNRGVDALSVPSIGASGAVFSCFSVSANLVPDNEFVLIFLPWFPIEAQTMLKGLITFDVCGYIYSWFRWSMLGHATHLGGVLYGQIEHKYLLQTNKIAQRLEVRSQIIAESKRRGLGNPYD